MKRSLKKGAKACRFALENTSSKASAVDRAYSGGKLYETVEQNREEKLQQGKAKPVSADAFEALGAFMKKREEAQGFDQLADFLKERETSKEPKTKKSQSPKL